MAETKNLKLYLWSGTDFPSYGTPNANYNKIDTAFGTMLAQVTEHTSDIETITSDIETIKGKLDTYDTKFTDLYQADAVLVRKITKNETDIENNKTDISVLKNRVTNVETKISTPTVSYGRTTGYGIYNDIPSTSTTLDNKKRAEYGATVYITELETTNPVVDNVSIPITNKYIEKSSIGIYINLTDLYGITETNNINIKNINAFSDSSKNVDVSNATIIKHTSDNKIYLNFSLNAFNISDEQFDTFKSNEKYYINYTITQG